MICIVFRGGGENLERAKIERNRTFVVRFFYFRNLFFNFLNLFNYIISEFKNFTIWKIIKIVKFWKSFNFFKLIIHDNLFIYLYI